MKNYADTEILKEILLLIVKLKNLMSTQKIPSRILLLIVKQKRMKSSCEMDFKV